MFEFCNLEIVTVETNGYVFLTANLIIYAVDIDVIDKEPVERCVVLTHEDATRKTVGDLKLAVLEGGIAVEIAEGHTTVIILEVEDARAHTLTADGVAGCAAGLHTAIEVAGSKRGISRKGNRLAGTALEDNGTTGRNRVSCAIKRDIIVDVELSV